VHPGVRKSVRTEFFGLGNAPDLPAPGICLHPYLVPVLKLADTEVIVRGGIEGETIVLTSAYMLPEQVRGEEMGFPLGFVFPFLPFAGRPMGAHC
jgi:hypothetical protein